MWGLEIRSFSLKKIKQSAVYWKGTVFAMKIIKRLSLQFRIFLPKYCTTLSPFDIGQALGPNTRRGQRFSVLCTTANIPRFIS